MHVKRTLSDTAEENLPGVKRIFESWGTSEEAPNQLYVVSFSDLPSDKMPMGPNLNEEAVFYGYFFKLLSYRPRTKRCGHRRC